MGHSSSLPLPHDQKINAPFDMFLKWTIDTSSRTLREFHIKKYDYAIDSNVVTCLFACDQRSATQIIQAFDKYDIQLVNALSLLTAIIAISDATNEKKELDAKLSLIFDAFDLSQKGSISYDEMVIMLYSFFNGLLSIMGFNKINIQEEILEGLVIDAFTMAKKPLHRKIRKKPFIKWARRILKSEPYPNDFISFVAKFNINIPRDQEPAVTILGSKDEVPLNYASKDEVEPVSEAAKDEAVVEPVSEAPKDEADEAVSEADEAVVEAVSEAATFVVEPVSEAPKKEALIEVEAVSKAAENEVAVDGLSELRRAHSFRNLISPVLSHDENIFDGTSKEERTRLQNKLLHACGEGNVIKVLRLLKMGVDENCQDENGRSPVYMAASMNAVDVLRLLYRVDAIFDLPLKMDNHVGDTPLKVAMEKNYSQCIDFIKVALLERPATTVYHDAVRQGNVDLIKEMVTNNDFHKETRIQNGSTVLMHSVLNDQVEILKVLIDAKADIDTQIQGGFTPLILAARFGKLEIVQVLVDAKADVHTQDADGETALISAACNGHLEVVKELIKAKVDLDMQDSHGDTALMRAVDKGNIDIVKTLIAANADLNMQNARGDTALMKDPEKDAIEVLKVLIDSNAKLNMQNNDGLTALMHATGRADAHVVTFLISAKVDLNIQDKNGTTALMDVASSGEVDIMKILIEAKANIELQNNVGECARDIASIDRGPYMVKSFDRFVRNTHHRKSFF